jgi:hypothetical protein
LAVLQDQISAEELAGGLVDAPDIVILGVIIDVSECRSFTVAVRPRCRVPRRWLKQWLDFSA